MMCLAVKCFSASKIINIIRRAGTSYCEQDQISTSVFILTTFLRTPVALYCRKKLENLPRTDRQINKQRIQLQRPLLSPVDRRGEWANCYQYSAEHHIDFFPCFKTSRRLRSSTDTISKRISMQQLFIWRQYCINKYIPAHVLIALHYSTFILSQYLIVLRLSVRLCVCLSLKIHLNTNGWISELKVSK